MIICNHNGPGHAGANDSSSVIHHGKVDIEPDFLSMVSTVACDAERQDNGPCREIKDFRAIELNDAGRIFMKFALVLASVHIDVGFRLGTRWSHSSSQLLRDSFGLIPQ